MKKILKTARRKTTRKPLKRRPVKRKVRVKAPKQKIIGTVIHYFPHVKAAVVKLKSPLNIGGQIKIKGHTTDFTQTVTSMQIDRVPIQKAKRGEEVGLLVDYRVRRKDTVLAA